MKERRKRLSILLLCSMLAGSLPTAVFAGDETQEIPASEAQVQAEEMPEESSTETEAPVPEDVEELDSSASAGGQDEENPDSEAGIADAEELPETDGETEEFQVEDVAEEEAQPEDESVGESANDTILAMEEEEIEGDLFYDGEEGVAINSTNFPDENFRTYISDNFDTVKDGILSQNEINAVTKMDCDDDRISTLKGIEYFTELQTLSCEGNDLTELDISQNTELTYLNCYNNKLTELDVSKNTELTFLSCVDNQLTELDVSKNTELTALSCSGNKLMELDVSKNTKLTGLSCFGNQLTSLDVSSNGQLTRLYCGVNRLTSLDVSTNKLLNDFDFNSNSYDISISADRKFYLSALPGNFDVLKTIEWNGGTIDGDVLTVNEGAETVTYMYQCDMDRTEIFTLNITETPDTTAPVLTAGTVSRTSESAVTVTFTSNESGFYFYALADHGEAAPAIDTTGKGMACAAGKQTTLTLDTLTPGAKDLYIVAMDGAFNVSEPLKIEIPALSYAITYDLDGGTAEGNPDSYAIDTESFILVNPTKDGYTFTGWSGTDLEGEANLTVTIAAGSTGVRTYQAHWEPIPTPTLAPAKASKTPVLLARAKAGNKKITLTWNKVKGAMSYRIYGAKCGNNYKLLKTVLAKNTSWTQKKLKAGTFYKYYVVAYGADGRIVKSDGVHAITSGGKYENAKGITVNKKSLSLKKGRKLTLKASVVSSGARLLKHVSNVRFLSSDPSVATVTKKGVVKAVKKGTCTIYCYAQNGFYKKVKVTVK